MTNEMGQTFIFFGIAGSGKGTQVKLLIDFLKKTDGRETVYAYPGNEFRNIVNAQKETGRLVNETMELGHLQPDFLPNGIVTNILINEMDSTKNLIADGYPRSIQQSETFESMMQFYKRSDVKIIYLELSKEEAIKRMKLRARPDDTDEGIAKRFDEYIKNVVPSMEYFKDKAGYQIFTINGEQSIEDVHKDIIKALGY